LYQPLLSGTRARLTVTSGAVASRLTVTEAELLRPALLVAEQVNVVPDVSVVTVVAPQPVDVAIPD
jgi:hypothetical protein